MTGAGSGAVGPGGSGPGVDEQAGPTLSVIVPATDHPPTLERCLEAIRPALGPGDELVVEDAPAPGGPAAARNAAARRAHGEVLVFIDADVVLHAAALGRIRDAFARDPELVGEFGCYDDDPEAPNAVSRFRNLLHHHVHSSSPGLAETFWAGLGALRREPFMAVEGFDADRYRVPSIEDIELGKRLRARGARIILDPSIRGRHLKAWSLQDGVRTDLLRRGAPWVELQLEDPSASTALNLGWRHRVSALASVTLLAAAVRRRPSAAIIPGALLLALNARFYGLLARRGGMRLLLAGIPLHVLHHMTAVAAVPVGALSFIARRATTRAGRWRGGDDYPRGRAG